MRPPFSRVTFPFFPGIRIFLENHQKPWGNGDRFLKRTMAEKNGRIQALESRRPGFVSFKETPKAKPPILRGSPKQDTPNGQGMKPCSFGRRERAARPSSSCERVAPCLRPLERWWRCRALEPNRAEGPLDWAAPHRSSLVHLAKGC